MLLFEDDLSLAIRGLLGTEKKLRIAVAFIGDGASQLIGSQAVSVKIICNLNMGGTNPYEVQNLIDRFGQDSVRHIDNFHAKLYCGEQYAIVGSANMSNNGLGNQPYALREAGYKFNLGLSDSDVGLNWFDLQWGQANSVSSADLAKAKAQWNKRDRVRNGSWQTVSRSIFDYDFDSEDFPLLAWWGGADWSVAEGYSVDASILGDWEDLQEAIGEGVDIECRHDLQHLSKDRWVLSFYNRKNAKPSWIQLSGTVLTNCFRYEHEDEKKLLSTMLINLGAISGPFDIDKKFIEAFRKLLFQSGKYSDLTTYDYEGCWFEPRIELMRAFWKELQSILRMSVSE